MIDQGVMTWADRLASWLGGDRPPVVDRRRRLRDDLDAGAPAPHGACGPVALPGWAEADRWTAVRHDALLPEAAEAQRTAAAALRQAQATIGCQVKVGIGEVAGLAAWPSADGRGVALDLPPGADRSRAAAVLTAAGIAAEVACVGGQTWAIVTVAPWYTAADIERVVVAVARMAHALATPHPDDAGPGRVHTHGGRSHTHGSLPPLPALPGLPPRYRGAVTVSAAPMAAADLAFDADGQVAWDRMWGADDPDSPFCELALAGGPPHRGDLLEPVDPAAVAADPNDYRRVVAELARGIRLTTGLPVVTDRAPEWIGVACEDEAMALWLLRAVLVENISARREGATLFLPAGPGFQLAGEIKNVITALAKTHHYWVEHQAEMRDGLPRWSR
jgi:hypothetical protein